jgi:hypothetical protein
MAYNYRLCLTNNASNRLPFSPPAGYTPAATEVLRRFFVANAPALAQLDAAIAQLQAAKAILLAGQNVPNV